MNKEKRFVERNIELSAEFKGNSGVEYYPEIKAFKYLIKIIFTFSAKIFFYE
jgi:hypothetical protein